MIYLVGKFNFSFINKIIKINTTRISNTLQKALNDQITLEAFSAQMYLMLACQADKNQLDGIKFMMKHSQEERVHMAKVMEYV